MLFKGPGGRIGYRNMQQTQTPIAAWINLFFMMGSREWEGKCMYIVLKFDLGKGH